MIKAQLLEDISGMSEGKPVSLLAKWLPSANASSKETVKNAKRLCSLLEMSEKSYRQTLSALRKYTDITENHLRVMDYTFDYEKQPSGAMLKYKKAFIRNDRERYCEYLKSVSEGKAVLHADILYPYEMIRRVLAEELSAEERTALDVTWNSLPDCGVSNENAIAVIDGSGSMTWGGTPRPIDAALSLGIYFAEHNKGAFGGHFITFSRKPRLVKVKGKDIFEKAHYCASYNECANTNLEAVFKLILMANNSFRKTDFQEIIHIMDTDGAFIPDANVIEDSAAENPLYSPTEIRTVRKQDIEKRNKVKSFNMNRLSCCKEMWGIKYSAYYMSCNLDHVLYNKLNLTEDEKSDNAFKFAKKYRNNIQGFISFMTKSDFAVVDDYNSSWKFIMASLHSLERHSNLGLCFNSKPGDD